MNRERLFELIRKEEVIIWAGAGLSLYAGFPSGKMLVEILYNTLSKLEKREVKKSLLLPDFAEEFCRIKGNDVNPLIQILNDTFINFTPDSIICHDKIASIPHFKTIITTNYDRLFETSYDTKAQVFHSLKQIPYLNKSRTHIFKVHGDLLDPESIIIRSSDYEHFFEMGTENDIFWTSIKDRIATNSVLFLGYNLEDINTRVLFKKITKALGKNRRECFMLAPNLSKSKINDLKINNIIYINSTAENFINELIKNIEDNICSDFNRHWVTIDTLKDFALGHNVYPETKIEDGYFKLQTLKAIKGAKSELKFTFKGDRGFVLDFNDFILGKKVGEFEFDGKNLINPNFRIGGIKWPVFDGDIKLIIKNNPKTIRDIDIVFEDGFEVNDLQFELFGSFPSFVIHTKYRSAQFKININLSEVSLKAEIDFHFEHDEICTGINDEIDLAQLLKNLTNGKSVTFFWEKGKKQIVQTFPKQTQIIKEADFFIEYFEMLKVIERHFKVKFKSFRFDSITKDSYKIIKNVISIINNEKLTYVWDGEQTSEIIGSTIETFELLKKVNNENSPLVANTNEQEEIEIHGQNILLGYKIFEIVDPFITNLEEVLSGENTEIKIISKSKKILLSYSIAKKIED